jgi:hypothetical protein
MEEWF